MVLFGGEELESKKRNPTLKFCEDQGMQLHFVSRTDYSLKENGPLFTSFLESHQKTYIIPEGGTNELAVQGCTEIITPDDHAFTTVCCSVGTGRRYFCEGLINAAPKKEVGGFCGCFRFFFRRKNPKLYEFKSKRRTGLRL